MPSQRTNASQSPDDASKPALPAEGERRTDGSAGRRFDKISRDTWVRSGVRPDERAGVPPQNRRKWFDRGRWMVERERFGIEDARPPVPFKEGVDFGALVGDAIKKLGLESAALDNALASRWAEIVGADTAKHTRPGPLDGGGTLPVYVQGAVWFAQMKRLGPGFFVERIHAKVGAGAVRTIRFIPEERRRDDA